MSDHIARVREQAERAAVGVFGKQREADLLPADYYQAGQMSGYIMGQIALASRLTREKIEQVIEREVDLALSSRLVLADAILALLTGEEA